MANLQHRLAALWFADIVGFSEFSHEDESAALELVQLFQGITRGVVGRYGGHLVKFVGDGALAEFSSTEAAVRAACRLRNSFIEQTKDNGFGNRDLHIGVHVGEIATSPDGDVYGDGVNAAARIMNQAEPGQILASDDVWRQLRQRKEFQFEELGERDLRGAGQHVLHCVEVEDESYAEWGTGGDVTSSRIGTLYDELKRRRVFRVAVAYAVAAWLVTQIAATTVPELFLPAWITRAVIVFAILGFPIAIAIAWAYDITLEGLKRTPPRGAVEQREARFPLLQRVAAGLLIAVVLAGGWVGWNRWELGPTDISASTVAILPFDVRGAEGLEYLSEGMARLIATKISDVEEYQSVDPHSVLNFVDRIDLRDIDSQAGRTVAERLGARHYVLGSVIQVGEQLHLEASLYNSDKRDPTTQISVQGDANELMGLVDQLVGKILVAGLGESDVRLASLAAITTDSLDALKEYLGAEREYRAGSFSNAIEGFQRAIEIDSLFALAHYGLAASASWESDYTLWNEAATAALRHSDRLSASYRTLVQASHALVTGRPEEVRSLVGPYLDRHPNDIDALYLYGESLFHYNDFFGRPLSEARHYFDRALDLDPDNTPLMSHLMDLAALEGDFAILASLLQRVERESTVRARFRPLLVFATGDSVDQEALLSELRISDDSQVAAAVGKLAAFSPVARAAEVVAGFLLQPTRSQGAKRSGHIWLATIYLRGGRWEAAKSELEALKPIDPVTALQLHAFYAAMPFLPVPDSEVEAARAEIVLWDPPDPVASNDDTVAAARPPNFDPLYRHYLLGLLSARLGDAQGLAGAIKGLQTQEGTTLEMEVSRFLARHLEAHGARLDGDNDHALLALSESALPPPNLPLTAVYRSPAVWHAYERFIRAQLLQEKDPEAALGWYEGLANAGHWLSLPFSPMSHLHLAEIYERLGDQTQAAFHYSRFVAYWRDSDALQPLVAVAEQRLEILAAALNEQPSD